MSEAPKKVLVIDDSALSRSTMESMFAQRGFVVTLAANGEDGLKLLPEVQPDLVLIDVVMPQLNGWETCQRMRAVPGYESLPIIVVTSKNTPHDMLQAFEVGANEFVTKPVDEAELFAVVNRLLKIPAAG